MNIYLGYLGNAEILRIKSFMLTLWALSNKKGINNHMIFLCGGIHHIGSKSQTNVLIKICF